MNERFFQRIEVFILDVVIQILSRNHSGGTVFRKLALFGSNKALFVSSVIIGSSFVGLLGGYLFFILTSQVR